MQIFKLGQAAMQISAFDVCSCLGEVASSDSQIKRKKIKKSFQLFLYAVENADSKNS